MELQPCYTTVNNKKFLEADPEKSNMRILFSFVCFKMRNMKFNGGKNKWE